MKFNKWTMGLAAVGVVSLASAARADETKMMQVQTALSNTTLSGYVDTAAVWRPGTDQANGNQDANIPSYAFAQNDGFYLNAIDIALDRPQDESPWAAGYHVEVMAGPQSVPYDTGSFGIRQAYLALRTPIGGQAIDWKIGVWDTIIGYESSSDPLDPNYTRSYGYSVEPTTHTGILGTYKVNDMITVQAGIADGSQVASYEGYGSFGPNPINGQDYNESKKAYMGAIALTAPDSWGWAKGATLNAGVINNDDGPANGNPGNWGSTSLYAGVTVPTPITALKFGAAFDWRDLHNAHFDSASDASLWVVGLYGSYQINDKASVNVRGEHLNSNVDTFSPDLDELTATLQYNLWANVISRVEVRWDHSEHFQPYGDEAYAYGEIGYYTDYAYETFRNNDFMIALNLIYQF